MDLIKDVVLGPASVPHGNRIAYIRAAEFPRFRFEWHPAARKVYLVSTATPPGQPLIGEAIAFDIENHGQAINAVNVYLRGYRRARLELTAPDLLPDQKEVREWPSKL